MGVEQRPSWWASNGHKFFAAAVITAIAVFLVGWFTDAREVMHDVLISIAVVALLPFAIVLGGLLLALLVTLVLSLPTAILEGDLDSVGGELIGDAAVEGGGKMIPWYYRFFARQRHPLFWGIPAGVLLGALSLWAGLALTRLPHERETTELLQRAKADIEQAYRANGSFPEPVKGRLVIGGVTYKDGFGQPLVYDVDGVWKLATWSLRSYGYDGKRSDDDFCVRGESKLVALAAKAIDEYSEIKALRCE